MSEVVCTARHCYHGTRGAGFRTRADFCDYYRGSHYGNIIASTEPFGPGSKTIGLLQFAGNNEYVSIQWIEVAKDWARKGVGSALVDQLAREFPDAELDWGGTTPEGTALRKSINARRLACPRRR